MTPTARGSITLKSALKMTRAEMAQIISTHYAPGLSPSEYRVLMFIFDRTYVYNKHAECIPLRHFLDGVKKKGGEVVTPGVGLSRRMVLYHLQSLAKQQIITVAVNYRDGNTYAINPLLALVGGPMKPKKRDNQSYTSATHCTGAVQSIAPPYTKYINYSSKLPHFVRKGRVVETIVTPFGASPSAALSSLQEIVARTTEKTQAARQRRKEKLSATGIIKIWYDYVLTYRPDLKGKVDVIQFPKYAMTNIRRVFERGLPIDDLDDFFKFICANWAVACQRLYGPKTNLAVEAPDIRVVIKNVDRFYQFFLDNRNETQLAAAVRVTPERLQRAEQAAKTQAARSDDTAARAAIAERTAAELRQRLAQAEAELSETRGKLAIARLRPKPLKSHGLPILPRPRGVAEEVNPSDTLHSVANKLGLKVFK